MTGDNFETRQERREEKLRKKRERMPQHSKNMAKVYIDGQCPECGGKRNRHILPYRKAK